MTMRIGIRRASSDDAEAVYGLVLRALRETNARDYPASVIDRLASTLPDKVAAHLEVWWTCVAVIDGRVVGTGSLSGQAIHAVFVDPPHQGRGIGATLMDAIEAEARAQGLSVLSLQSSITAEGFYEMRGFERVREGSCGEERTLVMAKDIAAPSSRHGTRAPPAPEGGGREG